MRFSLTAAATAAAFTLLLTPATASATDDQAELWFNPSLAIDVDNDTAIEVETAQRFRSAANGPDTYFTRLWLLQQVRPGVTFGGAVERRINDGGADETRTIQQLSARSGVLRFRARLEQRFIDDADRTGVRFRPRVGVSVPLDTANSWRLVGDAEPFFTLRSTSSGGQDGLTGLRTQIGVAHDISDRVSVGLVYLRQQDIRRNRTDIVGHAPLISLELTL